MHRHVFTTTKLHYSLNSQNKIISGTSQSHQVGLTSISHYLTCMKMMICICQYFNTFNEANMPRKL